MKSPALPLPRLQASASAYPWYVLAIVSLGTFMSVITQTSVNAAYPYLANVFDASIAEIGWVGIGYTVANVTLLAIAGRLADLLGRKRVYQSGMVVFLLGSVAAGFAPSLPALVLARVVMGVGGAMMVSNSLALVAESLPANRRATAVACVETTVAVGMIVGPIAGGFLTELLSWRSIFFVNWPFGLLAFALVALVVRETPRQGHPAEFDLAGALTFGSGLVLLLVGTTLGARFGWDSPLVLGMVGASVLSLALFVRVERRAPSPMIALSLFANPVFSAANLAMVCCYVCMMSAMFLSPFYYERVLGYTPAEIGLAFLPIPIGLSISSMAMGPLADRVGTRWIAPGGLLVAAIGCLLLIRVDPAGGYPAIFVGIVTLLLGLGAFIAPINSLIIGAAPPDKLGLASGFIALSRGLGMSFGLALAASLLSARLPLYESAGLPPLEAFVSAFHDVWKAALIVCLVGAGLASVQRSRNAAPAPH